jgi:hypothetical protein
MSILVFHLTMFLQISPLNMCVYFFPYHVSTSSVHHNPPDFTALKEACDLNKM